MARTALSYLSDNASIWVFGANRRLEENEQQQILKTVDRFLAGWTSHGSPVTGAREFREGRFLIVAAEKDVDMGGCSIDRLYGVIDAVGREIGATLVDSNLVFYRDANGDVQAVTRAEFREMASRGSVSAGTSVFDPAVTGMGDLRSGRFETAAAESWHGRAFGLTASATAS